MYERVQNGPNHIFQLEITPLKLNVELHSVLGRSADAESDTRTPTANLHVCRKALVLFLATLASSESKRITTKTLRP